MTAILLVERQSLQWVESATRSVAKNDRIRLCLLPDITQFVRWRRSTPDPFSATPQPTFSIVPVQNLLSLILNPEIQPFDQ